MNKEKIVINGEEHLIPVGKNLSDLLDILEIEKKSVALELNQQLITKSEWQNHIIKTGDKIEIVQFVGGGI